MTQVTIQITMPDGQSNGATFEMRDMDCLNINPHKNLMEVAEAFRGGASPDAMVNIIEPDRERRRKHDASFALLLRDAEIALHNVTGIISSRIDK